MDETVLTRQGAIEGSLLVANLRLTAAPKLLEFWEMGKLEWELVPG